MDDSRSEYGLPRRGNKVAHTYALGDREFV